MTWHFVSGSGMAPQTPGALRWTCNEWEMYSYSFPRPDTTHHTAQGSRLHVSCTLSQPEYPSRAPLQGARGAKGFSTNVRGKRKACASSCAVRRASQMSGRPFRGATVTRRAATVITTQAPKHAPRTTRARRCDVGRRGEETAVEILASPGKFLSSDPKIKNTHTKNQTKTDDE